MRSFTRESARYASCCLLCWLTVAAPLSAGVVTDGSVGPAGAIGKVGSDFAIPHTLGAKVGGNLFHSFSELNLLSGESASFSGPGDVANVLARVTGGSPSSIDGTLRSTIPGANLFLMNPKGVAFGPNAKLDISGSFAVTSADYLRLADGGRFNAQLGAQDSLTTAPVSAFGFLSNAPASVTINGSEFSLTPGATFASIAGDFTLDGGGITGAGSRVQITSVRATGEASAASSSPFGPLTTDKFAAMGEMVMRNRASLDTSGPAGGRVAIRGGRLVADQSAITSDTSGPAIGEGLSFLLRESVRLTDTGISTRTTFDAPVVSRAGDAEIVTGSFRLAEGAFVSTSTNGPGTAGTLKVAATGEIEISTGGLVANSRAGASGPGGRVEVSAARLSLSDGGVIAASAFGFGPAGDLSITVNGPALLKNGGQILAHSFGPTTAGHIDLHTQNLIIDGANSGIRADTFVDGGQAGTVQIVTDDFFRILHAAKVGASAIGGGTGGFVQVDAGSLSLIGETPGDFSGLGTDTSGAAAGSGRAGDVVVNVDRDLQIRSGARIGSNTFGPGHGGNVSISARNVVISRGSSSDFTGISATSNGTQDNSGGGGDITLVVRDALQLLPGGVIEVGTFGPASAGNVKAKAGSVLLDQRDVALQTRISARSADALRGGAAGSLRVEADSIIIAGGASIVTSTAGPGHGGDIELISPTISLRGDSTVSASAYGAGAAGSIEISARQNLMVNSSSRVASEAFGLGDAGSIHVSSPRVALSDFASISVSTSGADQIEAVGPAVGPRVSDLRVQIEIEHTFDSDLTVSLLSPLGTRVPLFSQVGGSENDFHGTIFSDSAADDIGAGNAPFTGEFRPAGLLADLNGQPLGGEWILSIADTFRGDVGRLVKWSLLQGGDRFEADNLPKSVRDKFTVYSPLTIVLPAEIVRRRAGNGGSIILDVGHLSLESSASIVARSANSGTGGNITITGDTLEISGSDVEDFTGIFASSDPGAEPAAPHGRGGDVKVNVKELALRGTANISTSTYTPGPGGDVIIDAGKVSISGGGLLPPLGGGNPFENNAGIFAESQNSTGAAGRLTLTAAKLAVTNGAVISTSTNGLGDAGPLKIIAQDLLFDGSATDRFTGVFAATIPSGFEPGDGGGKGGAIDVRAGSLRIVNGAGIASSTLSSGDAGNIMVRADTGEIVGTRRFQLFGPASASVEFGGISASSEGAASRGKSGNVNVQIGDLTMSDGGLITARTTGFGDGGSVQVIAPLLVLRDRAYISAGTLGGGDGGGVNVISDQLTIEGFGTNISARTEPGSTGDGGMVRVQARELSLRAGGLISAETLSAGTGGDLQIDAGKVTLVGRGSAITVSNGSTGLGASGAIRLVARTLELNDRARILAETSGPGRGGNIEVSAGEARVHDDASISADTRGSGRGGRIRLDLGTLRLDSGGSISATTSGRGTGGDLTLVAREIGIRGNSSGLFAESRGGKSAGSGGNIQVGTGTLSLSGGRISTSTVGDGSAGTITVKARRATLAAGAIIESSATAGGTAGSLSLQVESPLKLTGGSALRTTSALTNAGQIAVQSASSIGLEDSTISVQALAGNAGNVSIQTPGTLSLRRSQVLAAAGIDGGNISIAAQQLVLDSSQISANAIAGAGGRIALAIEADGVLGGPDGFVIVSQNVRQSADSLITASSEAGIQGTLAIDAPVVDLTASLSELQGALVDTSIRLQERCIMRLGVEASSFLAIGRGSVELSPEEIPTQIVARVRRPGVGKVRAR